MRGQCLPTTGAAAAAAAATATAAAAAAAKETLQVSRLNMH